MKILLLAVLSLHLQIEAVLPEEVKLPKRVEYKDGKASRRDRRKKIG